MLEIGNLALITSAPWVAPLQIPPKLGVKGMPQPIVRAQEIILSVDIPLR